LLSHSHASSNSVYHRSSQYKRQKVGPFSPLIPKAYTPENWFSGELY
jgi:hypothetical protein